jgi:hypothetical protein
MPLSTLVLAQAKAPFEQVFVQVLFPSYERIVVAVAEAVSEAVVEAV